MKSKDLQNLVLSKHKNSDAASKIFRDLNGMYNAQNDRFWAVDHAETDKNGGLKQKQKFPLKVMVWVGAC